MVRNPEPPVEVTVAVDPELRRLRNENAVLRERLENVKLKSDLEAYVPSFGMSEGVRADVEMHGQATDPYTGKTVTRDDLK